MRCHRVAGYVRPAVIALLGSYMICREEQEDTLKSLWLIPVDEVKLTLTKMVLALVFSVLIYLRLFDVPAIATHLLPLLLYKPQNIFLKQRSKRDHCPFPAYVWRR